MSTLADRTAAALDEIEATALAATQHGSRWQWVDYDTDQPISVGNNLGMAFSFALRTDQKLYAMSYVEETPNEAVLTHIALHDPDHVLRWVAGMREILALHRYREFQGNTVTATSTQMTRAWYRTACQGCGWGSPCPTLCAAAAAVGVEVGQ